MDTTNRDQPALLADLPPIIVGLPKKLADMHSMFGATENRRCATCVHLERFKRGATWFKCMKTRQSNGAGTDWNARWPACGKYEEK